MRFIPYAILAYLLLLAPVHSLSSQPPLEVRFQTADGLRISGTLRAWDEDGIDGSFGRRPWSELDHRDVWRLHRRLMEDTNPAHWLRLGRILLLMALDQPGAERNAEQALARALRLNPAAEQAVEAIREEAAEAKRLRSADERRREQTGLSAVSPEAGPTGGWPAAPWPELDEAEQLAAVRTMKAEFEAVLEQSDLLIGQIETAHFIVASELDRSETIRLSLLLDRTYQQMLELLDLPAETRLFWGKAAVFIFKKSDRYRVVNAEAFGHVAPARPMGVSHPIGPKVFLVAHAEGEQENMERELVHLAALAVLHRHISPKRLPAWANEGLAERAMALVIGDSHIVRERRRQGQAFIRAATDLAPVLGAVYADESWYGSAETVRLVGGLLVELLMRQRPEHFRRWVAAVKGGEVWTEALETRYGTNRAQLAEIAIQYWRVND